MDRESEEHDENRENREQSENGGESEEESEVDAHLLLRKINEQLSQQREDGNGGPELKFDDLRRLYELNNNSSSSNNNNSSSNCNNSSSNNGSSSNSNNGHATHIPEAHRPPSCSNSITSNSTFSAFTQHFPSDRESRERLMQYHLSNYLGNASYQQQFASATALPNLSSLSSSIIQPGSSFQSLPGSRIPSPHGQQFQRKQTSPQPFGRSSPSFQSPPPAHTKRSASVSSRHSREEESSSPVHQTTWSFEEQFKQLYDIDRNDAKRKEFLDDLFSFMQKHETPVTRLPIMAKSVLDLYELYKLVVQRGGLVDVINKKLWQEVIKGLNLPSSITSAAFTLRTQYMKFLYAYECHKLGLSTRNELETAIEGNKREGRRTSYYGDLQMRSPTSSSANNGPHSNNSLHHHSSSRISPVSLVTTSASNNVNSRLQINGHSNQFANHVGEAQIPNVPGLVLPSAPVPLPTDPRIIEYFKHMNRLSSNPMGNGTGSSPDLPDAPNLNNLEMANLALWNIYNGVVKPPLPQTPILSFPQLSRPLSQDSNNEAPLDLGKNRKTDSAGGEEMRTPKREHLEDDESEESESESEEEAELLLPPNSSQASPNIEISTPLAIQIKINGIKYRGVLHPKRRKI